MLGRVFCILAASIAVGGTLFGCLLYAPEPEAPRLSGSLSKGMLTVDGHVRSYALYLPEHLPSGAPLVMALHGSDGNAARMRRETGFGFERLAEKSRFAVVYPEAYEGNWNACNIRGGYSANALDVDDVKFLTTLADHLAYKDRIDRNRVFAVGISRGGSMAYRLALEAPSRFRAIAAVAASVPAPENFKCHPGAGATSVLIMNGTEDPLSPFNGGDEGILGMYRRGAVLSSRGSAEYFAQRAGISAAPHMRSETTPHGVKVETTLWRGDVAEAELVAILGGGHGLPQPWSKHPALLGPSPDEPNGPELIWDFFARQ